ncbi:NUDIX hydrolase [Thermodesulfobacteriota bacterium]
MNNGESVPREFPPVPLVGVGALIVEESKIIMVKRGRPPSVGQWSIPGGLVQVGESLKDAVVREVYEETSLLVEAGELVELLERIFPHDDGRIRYHYVLADYLCRVKDGLPVAGSDVLEAGWYCRDKLPSLNVAPITMRVIDKAFDAAMKSSP